MTIPTWTWLQGNAKHARLRTSTTQPPNHARHAQSRPSTTTLPKNANHALGISSRAWLLAHARNVLLNHFIIQPVGLVSNVILRMGNTWIRLCLNVRNVILASIIRWKGKFVFPVPMVFTTVRKRANALHVPNLPIISRARTHANTVLMEVTSTPKLNSALCVQTARHTTQH